MALKPKSKHKGISTKTKNEGCCQNFGQAELPVLRGGTSGPGRNFRSCRAELPVAIRSAAVLRFGRKSGPKIFEFVENLALEAVGRWGNCRSTPKTSFYCSKTTNNSTNREIDPRPIWGYFLGKKIWKFFWAKLVELGDVGVKSVATKELLIPYDED
jgi:hypothetical protein